MTGWIFTVLGGALTLSAVYVRRRFVAVTIEGESMAPTFTGGERVLVRRRGVARLRRGDVVVVRWKPPPDVNGEEHEGHKLLVKRVTAVAGDPIPADVAPAADRPARSPVPDGAFIVRGDNAAISLDSRTCGLFGADNLLGIMIRRLA
ncbi:S26 family signal peptidase [Nonomuraea cavernae]|uniref:signal peptidase I n=1 Tax=Nonomuraea cavernae TaxID=2045107 RepID=A0A917Z2B4_9ACTN|nr:S26 family signal peptidase [Nonomuraea cavernae]MCA2188538.1 S26 family signal peptidase [Nonomuraea cavernae]GGO73016.1 hypothetical protein GCM10012289_42430 [Nonomuraea cavernae]